MSSGKRRSDESESESEVCDCDNQLNEQVSDNAYLIAYHYHNHCC